MNVIHRITGYDKRTDRLAIEHDVPRQTFATIREMARVPNTDPEAVGSYPLDAETAREVGHKLHQPLNVDAYDWFFEPFSEPD